MAEKSKKVEEKEEKQDPRPERIHAMEFLASHPDLSEEHRAGLVAFTGKTYMRRDQWEKALKKYKK